MSGSSLTLLICTHNRAQLLERMLSSLDAANHPADWDIRVLVIANGCTDATHALLSRRQENPAPGQLPSRWAIEPRLGKSQALNLGIGLVETDWVLLTDDDHRVDSQFLQAVTGAIDTHGDAAMFCGRILPDWDGTEPDWVHETGTYRIYPPPIPVFDEGPGEMTLSAECALPGGGNLALRTALLRDLGAFQSDLGPKGHNFGGGEDSEMVLKALQLGQTLRYIPSIVQFHHVDRERLRTINLIRLAYQRSRAITRIQPGQGGRLPLYLFRKFAGYLVSLLFSGGGAKAYFFLVRLASTVGEARGSLEQRSKR